MSRGALLPRLTGTGGIVWGAVLLARGDEVWRRLEGRTPDLVEELGTRVLGGRHLLQGLGQLVAPRATSGLVVAVDLTHAATMAALAVASPSRRRAATVTGAVALASALTTSAARRRASGS